MKEKIQSFPFNSSDIADAETIDYNNDTNLKDVNMNKTTILTAQKISNKYQNIRRKRKRKAGPKSIQIEIKNQKGAMHLESQLKKKKRKKI